MNEISFSSPLSRSLFIGATSLACSASLFAMALPGCVAETEPVALEQIGETQQADVATGVAAAYTASVIAKNFADAYRDIVGNPDNSNGEVVAALNGINAVLDSILVKLNAIADQIDQDAFNQDRTYVLDCYWDAKGAMTSVTSWVQDGTIHQKGTEVQALYNHLVTCSMVMSDHHFYVSTIDNKPDTKRIEFMLTSYLMVGSSLMAVRSQYPGNAYRDPSIVQQMSTTLTTAVTDLRTSLSNSCDDVRSIDAACTGAACNVANVACQLDPRCETTEADCPATYQCNRPYNAFNPLLQTCDESRRGIQRVGGGWGPVRPINVTPCTDKFHFVCNHDLDTNQDGEWGMRDYWLGTIGFKRPNDAMRGMALWQMNSHIDTVMGLEGKESILATSDKWRQLAFAPFHGL